MDKPRQFSLSGIFAVTFLAATSITLYRTGYEAPGLVLGPALALIMLVLAVFFTSQSDWAKWLYRRVRRR